MGVKKILAANWFMVKRVWKTAPGYAGLALLVKVLEGVDTVLCGAVLTQFLLDGLLAGIAWQRITAALAIASALLTLRYGLQAILRERLEPEVMVKLKESLQGELYRQAVGVELKRYDDPEFYTDFVWAMEEGEQRAMAIFSTWLEVIGCGVSFLGFGAVAAVADPLALLPTLIYGVMQLVLNARRAKLVYSRTEQLRPLQRRREYYSRVFYLKDHAKELRVTNIRRPLWHNVERTAEKLRAVYRSQGKKLVKLALMREILAEQLILNGGLYGYLLYGLLVRGSITPGELIALSAGCENIVWRMEDGARLLGEIGEHALYVRRMQTFLSLPPMAGGDRLPPRRGELAVEGLTLSYGSKKALDGVTLRIPYGAHIALVGDNGAGKTTLIKALLRLYDGEAGSVTLDGVDARRYDLDAWRQLFGTAFQDFQLYAATVGENVALSPHWERERVLRALEQVGLDLQPEAGVTKEFDPEGLELSGGEAQKLALARCLYADAPVWILDEPSAALDPVSEARFHRQVEELGRGKTVIFISHRLNTTRFADRIYLMRKGCIREQGTHEELLRLDGEYARLWKLQADRYRVE